MKRTLIAAAFVMSAALGTPVAAQTQGVEMTWMSIANWYDDCGEGFAVMSA
jgi:hypothetical protein